MNEKKLAPNGRMTTCGPACCEVSKPDSGHIMTHEMMHAHVEKHKDGSCDCDLCESAKTLREERQLES